jgi:crotonobetainyl-CoA:carnitine CoA-transferase CaiB-like acyl-CoA transferase
MTADDRPLQLRVLSLARGVAAATAARSLADLGAQVSWWRWAVERPGDWPADPLFRQYFAHGADVLDRVAAWPDVLAGVEQVAGHFDVLLTDADAALAPENALYERFRAVRPSLVVGNASHLGRTGPYAGWVGDELVDYAMGGYWGLAGHPDREPLRVPGFQAQFHGGTTLALGVAAAARHARITGDGQEVDVAAAEAMLGAHWDATVAWTHIGTVVERTGPDLFRTSDGTVFFYQVVWFPNLLVLIDRPDLAGDERWATWPAWLRNAADFWDIVRTWCADRTTEEIVQAAQALRLPVVAMADAPSLLADPTLAERGYFREVDGARLPGRPALWSRTWDDPPPPEPALATLLDAPRAPIRTAPAGATPPVAGPGPLAGVRVLELTNNWAGPLAGRHLGDLGAEVIKIEMPTKPATRAGFYPGGVPGRRHWNRSGYFNEMNRNKRSVALNLADPLGKQVFLDLVADADVVLQNNSARVMPKLGLGYDVLSQVNPGLVMASISGFGATGARRDWVAFGSNIEVASGLAAVTGYDDETPYRTGSFVADPIAGTQTALAIVAALEGVARTGLGVHLDVSLIEVTLPYLVLSLAQYQSTGAVIPRRGNADPDAAPTGAYPTDGADEWVAVAVRTDEQWQALCAVTGLDVGLGKTVADRVAARAAIDAAVAGWTSTVSQTAAAHLLQAAGVPAAPILKNPQFHTDPHLFARQAFLPIDHPDTGVLPYPGFPWRFGVTRPAVRSSAPPFAEGNAYVFGILAQRSPDDIAALYDAGVTTDEPTGLAAI